MEEAPVRHTEDPSIGTKHQDANPQEHSDQPGVTVGSGLKPAIEQVEAHAQDAVGRPAQGHRHEPAHHSAGQVRRQRRLAAQQLGQFVDERAGERESGSHGAFAGLQK